MMSELEILQKVTHPCIMQVKEILQDSENYYIASEICEGGELFDRILQVKQFSEQDAANIVEQVLRALNYMHGKRIAHRDLKPENILLDSTDVRKLDIKITDFGFSCFFDPTQGLEL